MPVPMLKNVDRILYIQLVILFLSHNIFLARRILYTPSKEYIVYMMRASHLIFRPD